MPPDPKHPTRLLARKQYARSDTGIISDQPSVQDQDHGHDDDEGVADNPNHAGGGDGNGIGDGPSTVPEVPAVDLSTATRGGGGSNIPVATAPSVMTGGGGGGKGGRVGEPVEVGPEVLGRWFDLLSGYGDLVRRTIRTFIPQRRVGVIVAANP